MTDGRMEEPPVTLSYSRGARAWHMTQDHAPLVFMHDGVLERHSNPAFAGIGAMFKTKALALRFARRYVRDHKTYLRIFDKAGTMVVVSPPVHVVFRKAHGTWHIKQAGQWLFDVFPCEYPRFYRISLNGGSQPEYGMAFRSKADAVADARAYAKTCAAELITHTKSYQPIEPGND